MGGSIVVSTADKIVFDDEFEFSSSAPAALPLLIVSTPTGFDLGNNLEQSDTRQSVPSAVKV